MITTERILKTLSWVIIDMKYRHDETGIEGNYSPELQEAIALENELKRLPKETEMEKNI